MSKTKFKLGDIVRLDGMRGVVTDIYRAGGRYFWVEVRYLIGRNQVGDYFAALSSSKRLERWEER